MKYGKTRKAIFSALCFLLHIQPLFSQSHSVDENLQLVGTRYQPIIIRYLIDTYQYTPEGAKKYSEEIWDKVRSDGLSAKDFYDLFVFQNKTYVPYELLEPYLRSCLLEGFNLLGQDIHDKIYLLKFSPREGFLWSEYPKVLPRNTDILFLPKNEVINTHFIYNRIYFTRLSNFLYVETIKRITVFKGVK